MEHRDARRAAAAPLDSEQIEQLTNRFRNMLSTRRINELQRQRRDSPAPQADPSQAPPSYRSLRNLPLVPQPPPDARSIRFQTMLNALSQTPVRWEKPDVLDEALRLVPLSRIYDEAEEESQILKAEAESVGKKPTWVMEDCLIMALLKWFQRWFTWVDNPECSQPQCGSPTVDVGMAAVLPHEQRCGATQVELYQCTVCAKYERFPRYTDARALMETRRGRAGEWVNCFGMFCRALSARVRWVWNQEDHVWLEIFSKHQNRWVHVDVAEGIWDQPLLYTGEPCPRTVGSSRQLMSTGWGKKLSYCIAFSADGAMDVTRRYIRNPATQAARRNRAPEAVLLYIINEIRAKRRADMSKQEKFRLQGEDMREARELQNYLASALATEICHLTVEELLNGGKRSARPDPDAQKALEAGANDNLTRERGENEQNTPNPQVPRNEPRR